MSAEPASDLGSKISRYLERPESQVGFIGPTEGFSPQIGTLVSMMAFTRWQIIRCVQGMSTEDLDFLLDANSNTIGATLLHLAATEVYYGLNTLEGCVWGEWSDALKQKWDVAMNLGQPARETIKGHSVDYYLTILHDVRQHTLSEFRKRDDAWLATTEKDWDWNNYCKWFHVAEHESNHNGQFKLFRTRLPSARRSATPSA